MEWVGYLKNKGKNIIMQLFHISENYFDNDFFNINSPNPICNKLVVNGLEDGYIKRTCFSLSIDKCIRAIAGCVENKTFNVYIPETIDILKLVTNETILKNKYVVDAVVTDETWLLNKTKAKHVCQIKVGESIGSDHFIVNNPGKMFNGPFEYYTYKWEFCSLFDKERYNSIINDARVTNI